MRVLARDIAAVRDLVRVDAAEGVLATYPTVRAAVEALRKEGSGGSGDR